MLKIYNSDIQKISNWFVLFIILHGFYTFTPALRFIHQLILLDFGVVFIYFLSINRQKILFKDNKYSLAALGTITIVFLYCAIYKLLGISTASIGTCISYLSLFMSAVFGYIIVRYASYKQKKIILCSWTIIIAVNVLYNIFLYQMVFADIKTEQTGELAKELNIFNFGGTSFTGYVFFTSIIYLIFLYYVKNKLYRFISIIMFIICFYYTIYCGMRGTTAVLFVIAFTLLTTNRFVNGKKKNSANLFLILIIIIAFSFKEQVIGFLIDISPSERIAERFGDILETLKEGYSENSFTGRGNLFDISFDSWLRNGITFLFGIGELEIDNNSFSKYVSAGVSGHSDMVDTLAKYGIIGFILFIRVIWLSYKQIKSLFISPQISNIIIYMYICLILYGTIKIMFHDDIFNVVFILFPIVLNIIQDEISR